MTHRHDKGLSAWVGLRAHFSPDQEQYLDDRPGWETPDAPCLPYSELHYCDCRPGGLTTRKDVMPLQGQIKQLAHPAQKMPARR